MKAKLDAYNLHCIIQLLSHKSSSNIKRKLGNNQISLEKALTLVLKQMALLKMNKYLMSARSVSSYVPLFS